MNTALAKVLNGFFKAIYVITLPRLRTRQKALVQALAGLDYQLFYGRDRKNINIQALSHEGAYDPQQAAQYQHHPLHEGEIAVAFSHRDLYEHMLKAGLFPALVFEDDVEVPPHAPSAAKVMSAFKELPRNWELCYLGYEKNEHFGWHARSKELLYTLLYRLGSRQRLFRSINHYHVRPFSKHLGKAGGHNGAHAYGLSAAGCQRLYKKQIPLCMAADHLLQEVIVVDHMPAFVLKEKLFLNKSGVDTQISTLHP